jgi:tetratricopeptide (TPR) repeat protein
MRTIGGMSDPIPQLLQSAAAHHAPDGSAQAERSVGRFWGSIPSSRTRASARRHRAATLAAGCGDSSVARSASRRNHAAWCNRGWAEAALGRLEDALRSFRRAVELPPGTPEAHWGLGAIHQARRDSDAAIACFERALALRPDYVAALNDLGVALKDCGRLPEAPTPRPPRTRPISPLQSAPENCFRRWAGRPTRAVDPCSCAGLTAEAHAGLGSLLLGQFQLDEAMDSFNRALAIAPGFAEAHNKLAGAYMAEGNVKGAIASYRRAVELGGDGPHLASVHSNLLLAMNYESDHATAYAEAVKWRERHADPLVKQIRPYGNDRTPDRRLRVGAFSSISAARRRVLHRTVARSTPSRPGRNLLLRAADE